MKKIKLGRKEVYTTVDDDLVLDGKYCLSLTTHGYAGVSWYIGKVDGKYKYGKTYLHRLVMGNPRKGLEVDHINGNKLDNRKSNLRVCAGKSNVCNRGAVKGRFVGVHRHSVNNSWVAQIAKNYKRYHIGSFKTEEEAALAYNKAAKKLHGKYARLNEV